MKILTVIGARPQIIKAAALSRAINNGFSDRIEEKILHTGQHYDANMSAVFFDEMGIPRPHFNLNTGSGKHGVQTAKRYSKTRRSMPYCCTAIPTQPLRELWRRRSCTYR